MATYHASPTGGGNGTSVSSPFLIGDFWNVARPGDTLLLLGNATTVYRGPSSMINPPANAMSGVSGSPITIRAATDGAVVIDGEFARIPVQMIGNSWFVIEGINARNGTYSVIQNRNGSNNNTYRRIVAWDMDMRLNGYGVQNIDSSNTLFEDVAYFGPGVGAFGSGFSSGTSMTLRRTWGRLEGSSTNWSHQEVYGVGYANAVTKCENCLATATGISIPSSGYTVTNADGDVATITTACRGPGTSTVYPCPTALYRVRSDDGITPNGHTILGSLGYLPSTATKWNATIGFYVPQFGWNLQNTQIRHTAAIIDPSFVNFGTTKGFEIGNSATSGGGNIADRLTSLRGTSDGFNTASSAPWTITNTVTGSSFGAISTANPWTGTAGAQLCFRWVNSVLTNQKLWPWPMNDRIKAATASAGAYSGPCRGLNGQLGTCSGFTARTETDVTAEIEALFSGQFGAIPSQCLETATTPAPSANFSGTPTSGIAPLTVQFTDLSTNTPTAWLWTFGDGGTATSQNPSHVYSANGSYTVSLRATNAGGFTTKTVADYIVVSSSPPDPPPPAPTAEFSGTPRTGVVPYTVTFTDLSTGTPTTWNWNFGDGSTSTSQNPTHSYSVAGTYTVSLTASNANGSNTAVKASYITASAPTPVSAPVAAFTGVPTSGTVPLAVQFTDQSSNTPTAWLWTFGDGTTSAQQHPQHAYSTAGTFTVSLTATNLGGSNTLTKASYITVTTPPDPEPPPTGVPNADFTASTRSGKAPLGVNFTDLSTGNPTSWTWSFGDGVTSITQHPTHTYTLPGSYTVTLRVTNASGSDTLERRRYIKVQRGRAR